MVAAGSASAEPQQGSSYRADLASPGDLAEGTASDRWDNEKKEDAPAVASATAKPEPVRRARGIEVTTEQQQPKDFGGKDKVASAPEKALAKGAVAKNEVFRDSDGALDDNAETTTATTTPSNGYVGGAASGGRCAL